MTKELLKVICTQSGKHQICRHCPHAVNHDRMLVDGEKCTKWGECSGDGANPVRVRCKAVAK